MRDPARWFKPLLFGVSLLPLLWLVDGWVSDGLGANPIESLHHTLGKWTLRFLMFTLLITPLRLIPGWSWLTKLRRMLGLYAFFYASLHLSVYIMLDQQFDWPAIWADITQRRYITLGISAYLLMIPLVITSCAALRERLGSHWSILHKLIYLITLLGILHFYLLVKADTHEPLFYGVIFGVLLLLRFALDGKGVQKKRPAMNSEHHDHWS